MARPDPVIAPLTVDDLAEFGRGTFPSVKGIAARLDGCLVAIGGIAFIDGRVVAFCDLRPAARPYKVTIYGEARGIMDAARRDGRRLIWAEADPAEPNARRWLQRLGFRPHPAGEGIYQWQLSAQSSR